MKKLFCILLAVIICMTCISCSAGNEETAESNKASLNTQKIKELRNYFEDLAKNYVTSDGGKTVTVTIPDFAVLADKLPLFTNAETATADVWRAVAKENPELVKEYTLTVESSDEEAVFAALWEQVGIYLFISAMGEITLDFSDPYERGGSTK